MQKSKNLLAKIILGLLSIGIFFLLSAFVPESKVLAADPCQTATYYNEGEDIPSVAFADLDACTRSIGACCIKSTNTTIYGLTPSECTGGGTNSDRQAGSCPAATYACYIKNSSGTCQPRSEAECNAANANGTITYSSGATCSVGEAPGDSCYTKTNNICTLRDAAYCLEFESSGGTPYSSESACKTAGIPAPNSDTLCYYKNSAGACLPGNQSQCLSQDQTFQSAAQCAGAINPVNATPTADSTGTGGTPTSPNQSSATGTGNCAACLGLGGQAERDCYAQCSGTIQTGICAGMTATQCQQACSQVAGATTQICSGAQEGAGTPRAGEFLSCGVSSTNGCGQVDCIVQNANGTETLVGFVIETTSCSVPDNTTPSTPTTTTTTTKPKPTLNPDLAACGEACVSDNNCADALHSCEEGVCRLTSNPTSDDCTDPTGATPTPEPQPSPTPVPTANPDLATCNETCSKHSDCADLLHSCQGGLCRLTSNPGNAECKTATNTTPPTVPRTPSTPLQCNDPCTSNGQCTSFNHTCYNGTCRLSTNLDNVSCTAAVVYSSSSTQLGQINQQPDSPTALPSAGAEDFGTWIMTGIGALAVGAIILLLL